MSVWSVAAAQSGSRAGEIDWNISHHMDFIQQAAELQVDVLIFPELSLSGYELAFSPALAMEINDPRLIPFSIAASQYQSAGKSAFWDPHGRQVVQGGAGEQLVIARQMGNDWQGTVHSLREPPLF
ncbi:hypothetical protein EH228_14370 [Erwinia endophytica]|uniref:nitrilase-related carbon-nitrogen hydrolase n=1 Tax=Erwinia endophytica TaxID=1563158 RepID=UPI001265F583|nr:nitrilase-related carbon-nitrogen hydrolase [Erwinia endophytica]KAB8307887.1 hypothetical protein EH228_14370 [Erwinia endophytica]